MRIGYAKLGRSWNLDPAAWSTVGGDVDVYRLLRRLAFQHEEDEFILVGRNSGHRPTDVGLPKNVVNPYADDPEMHRLAKALGRWDPRPGVRNWKNDGSLQDIVAVNAYLVWPWFRDLDAVIIWAGQHGTSNQVIKMVGSDEETQPQTSSILYGGYLIRCINHWRDVDPLEREEIWLMPDVRNYLKCRDVKWPLRHPILGQYMFEREAKAYRWGDAREPGVSRWDEGPKHTWVTTHRYEYSGLELTAIDENEVPSFEWEGRRPFGVVMNENRPYIKNSRLEVLQTWVLPYVGLDHLEVFGDWSKDSLERLGRDEPFPTVPVTQMYDTVRRWKCTLTTPASGSGWATSKPWEAFAAGTVCFFHPEYDTQDQVLGDADTNLHDWLRVDTPEELWKRVNHLDQDEAAWRWLVSKQYEHLRVRLDDDRIGRMINERLHPRTF